MQVPFFSSIYQEERYGHEVRAALDKVIKSGHFILGSEVKRFEESLAEYCGVKHAIGVANASDALYLIVKAANLPKGAEVITSPYTFFASASCLVRNELKPIFADIDLDTFHLDFSQAEKKISKQTAGLLTIDLFSHPNSSETALGFAKRHKLKWLADSAEAFGMKWHGKHAGTEAVAGVLSFFPTKTLGCYGDGGAVITNDDQIAEYCRIARVHGAKKKYHHSFVGVNSRLDEIQAAILNVKMRYVDDEISLRGEIAAQYLEGLQGIEQVQLPLVPSEASPVWYVFAPRFQYRDKLSDFLANRGVQTFVYWPKPLHLQECFEDLGHKKGDFPNAELLCDSTLALPMFPGMTDQQTKHVIESIKLFYETL